LLPSRDRDENPLDEETKKEILGRTRTWFRKNFTGKGEKGKTRILEDPYLKGEYGPEGEFSGENIIEIYSYCNEEDCQRALDGLIKLAEWIRERANQDSVAIFENGTLHLVE